MRKRNSLLMLVSVSVAFFGVLFYTYAATTISTNIETAGTLTVTGASILTGAVTVTGLTTLNGGLTVVGSTNAVGTVTSGTWNGTKIGTLYGGTGLSTGGLEAARIPFGNGENAFATSSALSFSSSASRLTATYASTTALSATNIDAVGGTLTIGSLTLLNGKASTTMFTITDATATSTLYLPTGTAGSKGGCIQMTASDGTTILSLYATSGSAGYYAIWQAGACK